MAAVGAAVRESSRLVASGAGSCTSGSVGRCSAAAPTLHPVAPDTGSINRTFCTTLVDEWVRCGLTHAVISPGSRSTPMALALAEDGRLEVQVHHDERSASFMALGIARATGRPAVVLTTSGTAAVQLHAAVVEADLDRVPMLVLTADRPPELQGIGAPQTINQVALFGTSVRAFIDAGPPELGAADSWRALARRALAVTTVAANGPVQLNLPFREPLVGELLELPPLLPHEHSGPVPGIFEPLEGSDTGSELSDLADVMSGRRGLIVAGAGIDVPEDVLAFAGAVGWPVLADQRSGCRLDHPAVIAHGDAILRVSSALLEPEVILRLGAPLASKVLSQWLGSCGADQVLVDPDAIWRDPEQSAGRRIAEEPSSLCRFLMDEQLVGADADWLQCWRQADDAAELAIAKLLAAQLTPTEPGIARAVMHTVPDGAHVVVSSSMPIRDVEWFAARRDSVTVHANRGANGIDGVVSTAVGVAASGIPTALLIGDVAFLHDTNGLLGLAARQLDLCLVVIDNDGGGIFSFLPQRTSLDSERFEQLFGTPHGVDITTLANAHGLAVLEANDDQAAAAAITASFAAGGSHVVLVRTTRDSNTELHERLHAVTTEAIEESLRGE